MEWCGVVWCGVVWCGVVWYGDRLNQTFKILQVQVICCDISEIHNYSQRPRARCSAARATRAHYRGRIVEQLERHGSRVRTDGRPTGRWVGAPPDAPWGGGRGGGANPLPLPEMDGVVERGQCLIKGRSIRATGRGR